MLQSKSPKINMNNHIGKNKNIIIDNDIKPINSPREFAKQLPSSRLSQGMTGGRVQDIVAFFPQGEPTEPNRLSFVEHVNRGEKKIFSVSTTAPPSTKAEEVKHVGFEESAGDGFEYVLAVVNRKNGRVIEFRPTAVLNFQPRYKPDQELLSGRKRKLPTDYTQDFTINSDNVRDERRRLTANFGSIKKNKMVDAQMRRSITNETLKAMTSTAFTSTNVFDSTLDTKDGSDDDVKTEKKPAEKLSILENPTSSILPQANYSAKVPADVYTIDQFLPNNYTEMRNPMETEALNFFRQFDNYQKLIQHGIPPLVAKRIGTPVRFANPGRRCVIALKILTLAKLTQHLFHNHAWISADDFNRMGIPTLILEHVRVDFLVEPFRKHGSGFKTQVSPQIKMRALAELLCLLLLFDEPEFLLPISPLVQEIGSTEAILKRILNGMGCTISVASQSQAVTMNTVRVARLVGPPKKDAQISLQKSRSRAK